MKKLIQLNFNEAKQHLNLVWAVDAKRVTLVSFSDDRHLMIMLLFCNLIYIRSFQAVLSALFPYLLLFQESDSDIVMVGH